MLRKGNANIKTSHTCLSFALRFQHNALKSENGGRVRGIGYDSISSVLPVNSIIGFEGYLNGSLFAGLDRVFWAFDTCATALNLVIGNDEWLVTRVCKVVLEPESIALSDKS